MEEGIQFPRDADGRRSTTVVNKAIYAAALADVDFGAAAAVLAERNWRNAYPRHLRALTAAGLADGAQAIALANAGLAAAWEQLEFVRDGRAESLANALRAPRTGALHTATIRGTGAADIAPLTVPYHGQALQGDSLRRQLDRWEAAGIVEPSHGVALRRVLDHPEWLDLSDRMLVLLGAGSEAGPLASLAGWRANVVAVDLPDARVWERIAGIMAAGNGTLTAPVNRPLDPAAPGDQWLESAGADLLTQTPEIAAWLCSLPQALDIGAIAYLDGADHVRVTLAMDAIMTACTAARPATTLMFMATPTDIFVVPAAVARAAADSYRRRQTLSRALGAPLQALSGGRLLAPHVNGLQQTLDGRQMGIVDCAIVQQGPNYALAKRLQRWRALSARAAGTRVAVNVAPSTMTRSVIKNRLLKAGFDGAPRFGIEVFAPATTNALMAALWVHDLRCAESAANPQRLLDHPLTLFTEGANHGGVWRLGYLPRTALPLAAIAGFVNGS